MIAWMLYAALVAVLIAGGALALERLAATTGRPRRFVWLAALGLAVVIPLAGRTPKPTAPAVQEAISAVTSLANGEPVEGPRNEIRTVPVPGGIQSDRVAALAWGAASLTVLAVLGVVLLSVAWRRRRWERRRVAGPLVYVSRRFGPALVGVAKARVVVPSWVLRLEPAARDAIVRHEEEHARARDHLTLLCGGLVTAVFPWSPAICWMYRRLRAAVEMDCDERVLASGIGVADYGAVLLNAGTRSRGWWGFAPAMGHPRSLLERRLKTMSEKQRKLGAGRALVLAGVAAGALVAACDTPVPTELRDAIEEALDVQAQEARAGTPASGTPDIHLAKWFVSAPAPLVFVDDVVVGRYEDLPEAVRLWSESGLRKDGLVDRVEVVKGTRSRELYGAEGVNGAIRIFTKDRPADQEIAEATAGSPAESDRDNLWGVKFSGMAGSQPMPLVYIDGVRVDYPADGNTMPWLDRSIDIESMEIIKGAAAATLYGNEAAGGVILIHTKK